MDLEFESKRFDASGRYIRRWIPTLARLPNEYIHCPWNAPEAILDDAGVELGITYPNRVVQRRVSSTATVDTFEVCSPVSLLVAMC